MTDGWCTCSNQVRNCSMQKYMYVSFAQRHVICLTLKCLLPQLKLGSPKWRLYYVSMKTYTPCFLSTPVIPKLIPINTINVNYDKYLDNEDNQSRILASFPMIFVLWDSWFSAADIAKFRVSARIPLYFCFTLCGQTHFVVYIIGLVNSNVLMKYLSWTFLPGIDS